MRALWLRLARDRESIAENRSASDRAAYCLEAKRSLVDAAKMSEHRAQSVCALVRLDHVAVLGERRNQAKDRALVQPGLRRNVGKR